MHGNIRFPFILCKIASLDLSTGILLVQLHRASIQSAVLVVSKYLIPLNSNRIEILLDGGDGCVRTDDPRATLTQCA